MATASAPLSTSSDLDGTEDREPSVLKASIALMCLSILTVAMRLWARRMVRVKLLASDWVLLFGLIFTLGFSGVEVAACHYGLGKHILQTTVEEDVVLLKFLFAEDVLYSIALTCTKISILLLYNTIFPTAPSPGFRLAAYLTSALCFAWGLSTLLVGIFSCTPISDYWDILNPAPNCINQHHWYTGTSVGNILTDAAILALPVLSVCHLQLSWKQKVSVSALFLLGAVVLVASIVRLVFLVTMAQPDITWSYYGVAIWSVVEVNLAVISSCLPTLRPLVLAAAPYLAAVGLSLRSFIPAISISVRVRKPYATELGSFVSYSSSDDPSSRGRQLDRAARRGLEKTTPNRRGVCGGGAGLMGSFGSERDPESLQGFQESLQGYPYCETKVDSEPVVREGRKDRRRARSDEEMAGLEDGDWRRPRGEAGIIVQKDLVQEWKRTDCDGG